MRWPWRTRPESEPDLDVPPRVERGRDARGRLYDGDQVRPDGWTGWHDLLPVRRVDPR